MLLALGSKLGDEFGGRVKEYFGFVARGDLALAVAQTDVKGDGSKRPSEQENKNLYLRVVDQRDDGIIVRGAKAHTTQSAVSDEIIVISTESEG